MSVVIAHEESGKGKRSSSAAHLDEPQEEQEYDTDKKSRRKRRKSASSSYPSSSLSSSSSSTSSVRPSPVPQASEEIAESNATDKKKQKKNKAVIDAVVPSTEIREETEIAPVAEKKKRFIIFVGNLPFRCDKDLLAKLFKVDQSSVRIPAIKENNKPKGYAFIEFEDSRTLNKALMLHHTMFQERKINVELTAGGGGPSQVRKKKIETKNENLKKERKKLAEKRDKSKKEAATFEKGELMIEDNIPPAKNSDKSQTSKTDKPSKPEDVIKARPSADEPQKKKRKRAKKKKTTGEEAATNED